jgi:hypothetical protein
VTQEQPKLQSSPPEPNLGTHPIADFTDADLAAMLKRAVWLTAILGVPISLFLWLAFGWQTGALFAIGSVLSVASVYEWSRLIRLVTARMDGLKSTRGSGFGTTLVLGLFFLRLSLFALVIYVSLKCFRGSPIALLCGLGLALVSLVWEAFRILRQ